MLDELRLRARYQLTWQKERDWMARPAFAFVVRNARHVDNSALVARALARRGDTVLFIDINREWEGDARERIFASDLPVIDHARFRKGDVRPDVLVVMDDHDDFMRPLVVDAGERGITTVGLVEISANFVNYPEQYQTAQHVLCVGRFDEAKIGREAVSTRVGCPILDDYFEETPRVPEKPLVAVNCKFKRRHMKGKTNANEVRDRWLGMVREACDAVGVDFVISQHPNDRAKLGQLPVTTRPLRDVIRDCTVLISTPSAAIIEAMALGTPVVFHRSKFQDSLESDKFDEPFGAYRITETAAALTDALREALTWTDGYRARARRFLEHHLELPPEGGTMTEQAARALSRIRSSV